MTQALQMPPVQIDQIICKGGLDMITPTLSLENGVARQATNFECAVTGGYTRIAGYERFDGHASPTDSALNISRIVTVAAYTNVPAVGNTLTASGGATGVIAYRNGLLMVLVKTTGTWAAAETVAVGVTPIGTLISVEAQLSGPEEDAIVRGDISNVYRADIAAVPGSGPIRGVVEFSDVVYAFRDNAGATACDIYKSTASGWSQVTLFKTVSFTAGTTAPADGATLTQGGVTALIKRVVKTSGAWTGTAAGQFIIATPAGGNFGAGAATIGATTVTLSGIQTALVMLPGGSFEFEEHNFFGQAVSNRIYGCDGVNKAFEFDGVTMVPLTTGASPDHPNRVVCHKGYLFLGQGSDLTHSAPGLPYDYSGTAGAGTLAVGDVISGTKSMTGGTTGATLGIFSRNNTYILYGSDPTDWNLVSYNTGTGAVPFSVQNMAQTFAFDDRGVNTIQTSLQYGNFAQSAITNQVLPFINERINKVSGSTLCRRKSQYRVFFNDGSALFVTVVNNKPIGSMPVYFPNPITCVYEGKTSTGQDVIYFGSTNGMIYQMEKGTSFDGAEIEFFLQLNYSSAKSPLTLKRYRSASIELTAEGSSQVTFHFSSILGYDSNEYNQPDVDQYGKFIGSARWDNFTWDNFFWDSNQGTEPIRCELQGTAENIALYFSCSSSTIAPFSINSILMRFSPRRMMR